MPTAADVLIETIHDWGVEVVFGLPGDGINGIMEALRTRHEAVVDPSEPPMPPKITKDQAFKFAKSLARGQPNREKIALTVLSDKVRELV